MVIANLLANVDVSKSILKAALSGIAAAERACNCQNALADAIITHRDAIPCERLDALKPLLGKYVQ
jgi:hypothetical protein